jgi:hypothetical protein
MSRHFIRRSPARWLPAGRAAAVLLLALVAGLITSSAPAAHASQQTGTARAGHDPAGYRHVCSAPTRHRAACMLLIPVTAQAHPQPAEHPDDAPQGVGYGPDDLQDAYNLAAAAATDGGGETVAIVDAYDDPAIASDLDTYRSAWGLPACDAGCFTKVNQEGQASPLPAGAGSNGWDLEESADVDMVSAICPLCHILLVEADSDHEGDVAAAANTAVALGAKFVSNSYGIPESSNDHNFDSDYNHPGVAITAAAGDDGYGVSFPASSPDVISVGGTNLSQQPGYFPRQWYEEVWGSGSEGTGSGCSSTQPKPAWQTDTGCTNRTDNDVAADANPYSGVAVFDSDSSDPQAVGWAKVGGTSVAAPIIAATYALAGNPAPGTYPASYIYTHTSDLYDVDAGADGTCTPAYLCSGELGYDAPTGWGTPDGTGAFTDFPQWSAWANDAGAPPPGIAHGSTPAVSSWSSDRLDVFVHGADGAIWQRTWDGSSWGTWTDLYGVAVGNPTAVSYEPGQIDLFVVGTDGRIYHKFWDGNVWSGWFSDIQAPPPGIYPGASPAVSSWGPGRLDVVVRGADNAVWHDSNSGYGWSGWEDLGGTVVDNPATTSPAPGQVDVFAVGTNGDIFRDAWGGSSWSGWTDQLSGPPQGGIFGGASVAVSSWGNGRIDMFVHGGNNNLWHTAWNGSSWSAWDNRGGYLESDPAVASWGSNWIDLFAIGTDYKAWHLLAN